MVKILIAAMAVLALSGCQERYRYPCQDPRNWEEEMCKKPYCSANGTCPEDLRHYIKPKNGDQDQQSRIPQPQQNLNTNSTKGGCKC